jgi:hypothetical protein
MQMFVIQNTITVNLKRLFGALSSCKSAAYYALLWKLIKPLTLIIDKVLPSPGKLQQTEKETEIGPCLLIVSPPRSGSTIIYQVLIRAIRCVYFSNLHALLPRTASRFFKSYPLFGDTSVTYQNYYGYTSSIFDVNEGNEAIATILQNSADPKQIRRNFILFYQQIGASSEVPLIIKNVRNYNNLLLLHQAVPELVFLRIKRDRTQLIHSVLKAYNELGTFHPIPDELLDLAIEDEVEFAVRQILTMEQSLKKQQEQIATEKWITCSYEDFCRNSSSIIGRIATDYFGLTANSSLNDRDFHLRASFTRKENKQVAVLLQKLSNEYDV